MIVAIQQPEHFPWIGFFNKMLLVDEFIFLDNVQFKRRYFENRNKIRVNNTSGWDWITVPAITKARFTQKINELEIDYTQKWQRKYLNKLKYHYNKAAFFDEIFKIIEEIINKKFRKMIELNLALINFAREYLGIATPAMLASDICEGKGSDLILDLCLRRNANVYLSGPDGGNYLRLDSFYKNRIKAEYHNYKHPVYKQIYEPFISHMSAVDLLFNYGKSSIKIIKGES